MIKSKYNSYPDSQRANLGYLVVPRDSVSSTLTALLPPPQNFMDIDIAPEVVHDEVSEVHSISEL